jgi:hypothetical protein
MSSIYRRIAAAVVVLWIVAQALPVRAADAGGQAHIPLANYGGIRAWSADGEMALYIQSRNGRWYHAELRQPCPDLPAARHLRFLAEPNGAFDGSSSIIINGRAYALSSLVASVTTPDRGAAPRPPAQPS